MIRLEELHGDRGAIKKRKRVGRGESSGFGKTCGRGDKGARARAGFKKGVGREGGQTPLQRRVPKRGFTNHRFRKEYHALNVSALNRFDDGMVVDFEVLVEAGCVPRSAPAVKILGNGELEKNLSVTVDAFSASARKKIEAAGGSCRIADAE